MMTSPEENKSPIHASLTDYKGRTMIRLAFKYDQTLIEEIKSIRGRVWSLTHKCWYVPDTVDNRRKYGVSHFEKVPDKDTQATPMVNHQSVCQSLLDRVRDKIILKGYSPQTLKSYQNHVKRYLTAIADQKNPLEMTKDDIEKYLLRRHEAKAYSESDINSHINAIKFLYEQVLGHERMLFYLPRPEKPLQLPKVLGEQELDRLFRAVPNLKHKVILLTAFSCGLRVSEVVRLRYRDMDMERMQVFIERSKGKKDRYINLSIILKDVLQKYVEMYAIQPADFLFQGQKKGMPYSSRSAQAIFNRAVSAAGIHKKVTFHVLRHSYATHLMEIGVDTKYIKDLLGHFDIKTTERYLHVAREKLVHIQSPLDFLKLGI
jgi:site-specific recombinase XerD